MLLSTTYGLNISDTKRIHVGLQSTKNGVFAPVVKLSGNNADEIYFDVDTWQQFLTIMPVMSEYFNTDNKAKVPVTVQNISINFTTSYGAKAILLTNKENEEGQSLGISTGNTAGDLRKSEEASDPPAKKRRTYTAAVVMQKITFQGLENVVKCVDAHLKHLHDLSDNVNACAQYLIKEIELKLPVSYVDQDIIKLTLRGNNEIKRNVRTQIKDLTFLDMYFSIIFLELTSLRFNEILHIILSTRGL